MCVNYCFEKTLNYSSPGHGGWGIIRVAALIPESHQMFICPSACFRHGALGAIQHGYKDRLSYLYITPADIITGYDNLIIKEANDLLKKEKNIKVLFLFVPCMDDFLGTDIESVAKEVENYNPGVIVRACHMNPIAADTSKPPLVTTMHSMYSTIKTDNHATEDAVNICGSFELIPKECEIFRFLEDYGIEGRQLADYEEYEKFCEMGRSKYNLVIRPGGKFAAEYMDQNYRTRTFTHLVNYDCEKIKNTYLDLQNILEKKHKKTTENFNLKEEEEKTKAIIIRAIKKVGKIPISIADSAVLLPCSLAKALLEYGFNVTEVFVQKLLPADKESFEFLCEKYTEVKISQPRHHKSAVRNNKEKNTIAIGFEGAYLRESDYVVDLSQDEGMYGFYGVRRLMSMLEKSIEKKADLRKMIEEYGAVV